MLVFLSFTSHSTAGLARKVLCIVGTIEISVPCPLYIRRTENRSFEPNKAELKDTRRHKNP